MTGGGRGTQWKLRACYTRGKEVGEVQISQKGFVCRNAGAVKEGQGPIGSQLGKVPI